MKKRTVLYGSLTAALTVCFLLLGFFVFPRSYVRLKEAGADLVSCVKYYLHSVFIITSMLAAMVDSSFVIIQRYNRPRIVKINTRMRESNEHCNTSY